MSRHLCPGDDIGNVTVGSVWLSKDTGNTLDMHVAELGLMMKIELEAGW